VVLESDLGLMPALAVSLSQATHADVVCRDHYSTVGYEHFSLLHAGEPIYLFTYTGWGGYLDMRVPRVPPAHGGREGEETAKLAATSGRARAVRLVSAWDMQDVAEPVHWMEGSTRQSPADTSRHQQTLQRGGGYPWL